MDKKDLFEPYGKCPYKNECSSYPEKCSRCRHGRKRNYYEPDIYHPQPWWPRPVWYG